MRPVAIRRGTVADAAALAEFGARTFAEAFGAETHPDDLALHLANSYTPDAQAAELQHPDVITLLAWRDDALVGYTQVRRNDAAPSCIDTATTCEVQRFYLDAAVRGTGVAQALMERAFDAALELGGKHAWLGVWENNARGLAFYRKAGFVPVGDKTYVVGSDVQQDIVMLARDLDARPRPRGP